MRLSRHISAALLLCLTGCIPPSGGGSGSGNDGDGGQRGGIDTGVGRGDGDARPPGAQIQDAAAPDAQLADLGRPRPVPDAGVFEPDAAPEIDQGIGEPCSDRYAEGFVQRGFREPASLITDLAVPPSERVAREFGCDVVGANQGIGLAGILSLMGSAPRNLRIPEEDDEVDFIHIAGWGPETPLSGVRPELSWHLGQSDGGLLYSRRRDASFENVVFECPTLAADFVGPFELFTQNRTNPFGFTLEYGRLQMDVYPYDDGFEAQGTVTGYVTIDGLIEAVNQAQILCSADEPPDYCAQLGMVLAGEPEQVAVNILLPILRGADAFVGADGRATADCGGDCNAVSVCIGINGSAAIHALE